MGELAKKQCIACVAGTAPLKGEGIQAFYKELGEGWSVIDEHHLKKEFTFKNFKVALEFTNEVGRIAEEEGHHPDIHLTWGKVTVILWTHKIDGLSESDFIMADKCDAAYISHLGA